MKKLTEEELNDLSRKDRYEYYNKLRRFEWESKSFEEKDMDILSFNSLFVERRDMYNLTLEEQLECLKETDYNEYLSPNILLKLNSMDRSSKKELFTFFRSNTSSPFSEAYECDFKAPLLLLEGINDLYEDKRRHILQNNFEIKEHRFNSYAQFITYHKAITFLNRDYAEEILNTKSIKKNI